MSKQHCPALEGAEKLFAEIVKEFDLKKKPVDIYKAGKRIGLKKGEIYPIGEYLRVNKKIVFQKVPGLMENIFAYPAISE